MKRLITIISVFLISTQSVAVAQCCSAGNPSSFVFGDQNSLSAKSLIVSTSYKYGYSDTYYKGNKPEKVSFSAPASYSFLDLKIAYGISKRLTVQAVSGYFLAKEVENPDPYPSELGHGLGDAELNVRYRVFKSMKHRLELTATGGVRLPVGIFDQEKDGVKLPITVQPSSGSLVYIGGVSVKKTFEENKMNLYGSFFAEFPQLIDSKNFYYQYGNLYNLSFTAAYPVHKLFNPALQIQGEIREHATREGEQVVDASGYKVISLSPQVVANFVNDWSLIVYADIPVYRYFNGMQLANAFKAGIGLSKRFSLN